MGEPNASGWILLNISLGVGSFNNSFPAMANPSTAQTVQKKWNPNQGRETRNKNQAYDKDWHLIDEISIEYKFTNVIISFRGTFDIMPLNVLNNKLFGDLFLIKWNWFLKLFSD